MELQGRSVLLTGATGGIGHALARHLHRAGASLVLTGRRTEVLEPLASELGGRALAVDLADETAVAGLAEECAGVDVVVHNAALPASGPYDSFSVEDLDRALAVNLRAPIVLTRLLAPRMAERGAGHIAFISSLSGKTATPGSSIYSATKFGLRGFAQGLRADLRACDVGVSVVFPGFISEAGMFADSGTQLPKNMGTKTPDDVAAATLRAIRANRGEVDVAPASLRVGTVLAGIAPEISATISRRLGSERIAADMHAGQLDKR